MPLENEILITADIKTRVFIEKQTVTMNDTITLIASVVESGAPVNLTDVANATLVVTRLDKVSVPTLGEIVEDRIHFKLPRKATKVEGSVKVVIQLYDVQKNRVSTINGALNVESDPTGDTLILDDEDQTLVEEVLFDGKTVIEAAQLATLGAEQARDEAVIETGLTNAERLATKSERELTELERLATEQEREATKVVKDATVIVKDDTLLAKAAAILATENAVTATTNAENATEDATVKTADVSTFLTGARDEFTTDQAQRDSEFSTTQESRATAFNAAQKSRNDTYIADKSLRDNTYADDKSDRDSEYNEFVEAADSKMVELETTRANAESERLATEAERIAIHNQQEAFESQANERISTVETVANDANTKSNLTDARVNNIVANAGKDNTENVDARLGADGTARANVGTLIREVHAQQLESARQTTTLTNGVSIVNGGVDALADVEIEGRTLISLGNSNLEAGKQYVQADKKTKVLVDGVTQSGVAKFTKGTTTVATANFANKTAGSTVGNPHVAKGSTQTSLVAPSDFISEFATGTNGYLDVSTLNTVTKSTSSFGVGGIAQNLFSFDIIQEIERKLGIIPKATLAEKVQWVKDNTEFVVAKWNGLGSSVGGSKANFAYYHTGIGWNGTLSHTDSTVTALSRSVSSSFSSAVQSDGFTHFLAYADASDGVTPSSISTDYISLDITLKPTAQLITRPTIIRVEDFGGKVSGSVVENPHVAKYIPIGHNEAKSLVSPNSTALSESSSVSYGYLQKLDSTLHTTSRSGVGEIAQQPFSFNLIEAIERNIGRIPRTSTADKVAWLKENVARLTGIWNGFGSSVGGNKANLTIWLDGSSWGSATFNNSPTVIKVIRQLSNVGDALRGIDSNGFVHFLAYAEASDGVTASTINTDYIDLEIELKPTADFTNPKLPLYDVDATSYAKILVDWNADEVVNRYPAVEGTQHLQGVGVVAEGENLIDLDDFSGNQYNTVERIPNGVKIKGTYYAQIIVEVVPNTNYRLSFEREYIQGTTKLITVASVSGVFIKSYGASLDPHFNSGNNTRIRIYIYSGEGSFGEINLTNIMLNIGTTAKPFVPRNPSYLYADVKLGSIGTARDVLYEQDGSKFVRKVVETVSLGSSDTFNLQASYSTGKRITVPIPNSGVGSCFASKFDGKYLPHIAWSTHTLPTMDSIYLTGGILSIMLSNQDTGWVESTSPSPAEMKAFFLGWKMNNGTFGTPYDGTGTKTWIPIGDTSNARAVTTVPTSPSPTQLDGTIQPYKLSYVLATPQIVNVTDKVEGSLKVNGLTQVSIEAGYRRTVVDGKSKWTKGSKFDYTANPTNVKLFYANNVRSALEDVVGEVQDNSTKLSVHEKAIVDLYVRVKALGG